MTEATRWPVLDVLRGLAIGGIIFVNARDMTRLGYDAPLYEGLTVPEQVVHLTVQSRFVPLFTFLFGISLVLVLRSARRRGRNGWASVSLRLAFLLGVGLLHGLVYRGEILATYAVVGLVLTPVVAFTPRLVQLGLGVAATAAAYGFLGGGELTTPGLMLLGAAAAGYGLPEVLDRPDRRVAWVLAGAVVLTIPALWWQTTQPGDPRFTMAGSIAGLVMAVAYLAATTLLVDGPAGPALREVLAPVGRMALTNYVSASLVIYPVGVLLDFPHRTSMTPVLLLAAGVLLLQVVVSRLWLRRFAYGQLEWLWRMATWRQRVPMVR